MIADTVIKKLVEDTFDFQQSERGQEIIRSGAPPYYYKHIKLKMRRGFGFTTAALALLEEYTSSLIITSSDIMVDHVKRMADDKEVDPILLQHFDDHVISEWRVTDMWDNGWHTEMRYQLIILDPASIIENHRLQKMHELRDRLFMRCDILVELG